MTKIFASYDDQLNILRSKGLDVDENSELILLKLKEIGYYNLISGYSSYFKAYDKEENQKKYRQNIKFNNILSLYTFDTELRKIIYNYSIQIENKVKSSISYVFSKNYSHDDNIYLKRENFSIRPEKEKQINELIDKIKEEKHNSLTNGKKYKEFINHMQIKHGHVPLWCLIRILSFGTISKFYKLMKFNDQKEVADALNIKYDYLAVFLEILVQFRNIVAHGEKTFSYKCKKLTLSNKLKIYDLLDIKRNNNNDPVCGRKDVLALFIIFKYFLSKNDFLKFFTEFKYKLQELSENEPKRIFFDILREMGLLNNKWEELNNIAAIDLCSD